MRFFLSTLSLLLLAAIVWVTLASLPQMTTVPWIPNWLAKWADSEPTFRNFPPYAIATLLSTLTALAWIRPRTRRQGLLVILGMLCLWTLLGTGLECAQLRLPYRKFDLLDITWSVVGALAGSVLSLLCLLVIGDW
jgi:glycopeptide antibiotics resistance protein